MKERAVIFIDGNNFYHAMRHIKLQSQQVDYEKFSRSLAQDREWLETRYYVGKVSQKGDHTRYGAQRKFLDSLSAFEKVSCHLGRVEKRPAKDAGRKLRKWLDALHKRDDISLAGNVIEELRAIAAYSDLYVEKAVDVMIAVDMVSMAYKDEFDVAYLLSADGDFVPAVQKVREIGKKVFVASPSYGHQLARAANTFIRLEKDNFSGCWR